jgi:hypothetical protein
MPNEEKAHLKRWAKRFWGEEPQDPQKVGMDAPLDHLTPAEVVQLWKELEKKSRKPRTVRWD